MLVSKGVVHLPVKSSTDTQPYCWLWEVRTVCLSLKLLVLQDRYRTGGENKHKLLKESFIISQSWQENTPPSYLGFRVEFLLWWVYLLSKAAWSGLVSGRSPEVIMCLPFLLLLMAWGTSLVAPALQSPPISLPLCFACTFHS